MANAPHPLRDGRRYATDLRENESRIFSREGLDRLLVICPSGSHTARHTFRYAYAAALAPSPTNVGGKSALTNAPSAISAFSRVIFTATMR